MPLMNDVIIYLVMLLAVAAILVWLAGRIIPKDRSRVGDEKSCGLRE